MVMRGRPIDEAEERRIVQSLLDGVPRTNVERTHRIDRVRLFEIAKKHGIEKKAPKTWVRAEEGTK